MEELVRNNLTPCAQSPGPAVNRPTNQSARGEASENEDERHAVSWMEEGRKGGDSDSDERLGATRS